MAREEISFINKSFTVENSLCCVMREMERAITYAGRPESFDDRTVDLLLHTLWLLVHQWDWYCGGYWTAEVYSYSVTRAPTRPQVSIRYFTRNILRGLVLDLMRIVNRTSTGRDGFARVVLRLCRDDETLIGLDHSARRALEAIAQKQEVTGSPITLVYQHTEGDMENPDQHWFSLEN